LVDVDQQKTPYTVTSKSFTAVAVNTAAKAGQWVKSKLGEINQLKTKTSSRDLVTEVDKGAETMIRNLIHTHFPQHSFLGEEGVEPGPDAALQVLKQVQEAEYLWIVDPIDGTTNFVHGFPFFAISIALAHKGELIVGVIYDPSRDELFVAEKGKGAYVAGKRMCVSSEEQLSDCLLASGFPSQYESFTANLNGIRVLVPQVRNIRTTGSAALHLAYVAAGRISGFWEYGLSPWDMAAGVLLVKEAGGHVTDISGEPYHLGVRHVLASNGKVHAAIQQEVVRSQSPDE
jgi:myo-inositol-1(or 4)-monophosphatase